MEAKKHNKVDINHEIDYETTCGEYQSDTQH